ncbi:endopeptidase La [Hippea maritima]|uniref:Lon protease n=1 Tax=Hippea maritima (strain ATCC 700847 / DSM 10411 / MH2) TaxID=760142 RepID=F2LXD2_HIPMA|nr:endopeptidase La [Hippea maritima]AEA34246.1 anti-sigma H sporulation factor, LonB [Hippea maritima DSM 10411]
MEQDTDNRDIINLPDTLPVLPLRDMVVFPYMIIPLFVGRDFSIKAIDEALSKDRIIVTLTQKKADINEPKEDELYTTGTACLILRMLKMPDGRVKVLVQGLKKVKVRNFTQLKPYMEAEVEEKVDIPPLSEHEEMETEALMRAVKDQLQQLSAYNKNIPNDIVVIANNIEEPDKFTDIIASNLQLKTYVAQELLEIPLVIERLKRLNEILDKELQLLALQTKIQNQAKEEISKTQKEYFLREQMKAIKKELGEGDISDEIEELKEKIKKAKMPKEAQKEAEKQLLRLSKMHPDSAEANVIRTYLDWLIAMPWSKRSQEKINIKEVERILNEDHYDIKEAKLRILEYLSVKKLKKDMKGPILCFVGPPGVGKTSLAKSIARAINRKLVRISLGGVRDEAEIRGHRRTYVGALPGRIIQGLKQAGVKNPVFVLDEIDKLSRDFSGDPASALLEALDPEQNSEFEDHYLGVPFDLSEVFFITTANTTETIPPPLLDRMEVIRLSGYTVEEKMKIAKKYIIPKQIKEHGLDKFEVKFTDGAIRKIIENYTREAGVRNLEKTIAKVLRKIAKEIAEGSKQTSFQITSNNLLKYLGVPSFSVDEKLDKNYIGIATGLAWTPVGGSVLFIEVSKVKGSGKLLLTGSLGDVMKESAQAALTFARSRYEMLGLDENFYEKYDLHIHVPEGATPKDGPSAGITIATAIISCLTETPVRHDIAMTGEITLTGRVLPIGGLKEKTLAALRAGINEIIVPYDNKKDAEEVQNQIKSKKLKYHFVKTMEEVLDKALAKPIK